MAELLASIAANGLRQHIEVFKTEGGHALISGLRRLTAVRNLCTLRGAEPVINAFTPSPATLAEALTAMVKEPDDLLATPEHLFERQILHLAASIHADFTPLIVATLQETCAISMESQWQVMLPILVGTEQPQSPTSYRPRRMLRPVAGMVVRREMAPDGWLLRFTGPEAIGPLMDLMMD